MTTSPAHGIAATVQVLAFDVFGQIVTDDPNLNGSLAFYRLGQAS